MSKNMKRLTALFVLIALVIVTVVPSFAASEPSSYSKTRNSGKRHVVCTTLNGTSADDYYEDNGVSYDELSTQSKSVVLSTLRTLMKTTHKKQTSYGECQSYADETDCENENTTIVTLYTSYKSKQSEYNSGSGWNREHVWPKSLGGFNTSGAGADLHHIRPSENKTNGDRGNLKYGEVNGGTASKGNLSGIIGGYKGSYYEPLDNVKGDVARICLYVYVRYGGELSKCNSITNVFQSVDVLLAWCEMDPVDTWEMGRNEVVQKIQGNRNVFIDYPEYAWLIFGREVPDDMTTPSGEAKSNSGNSGSNNNPDNESPFCTHTNTEIVGAKEATCGATGYTGDKYCKDCDSKLASGTTTLATGQHTWGAPVILVAPTTTAQGSQKYTCTVCSATKTEYLPKLDAPADDPVDPPVVEPVDPPVDEPADNTDPNEPIIEWDEESEIVMAVTTALLKQMLLKGLLHS